MNDAGSILLIFLTIVLATINGMAENRPNQYGLKDSDIVGKFIIPNGIVIEIFREGQTYSGIIVDLDSYAIDESRDIKNPNKEKRNQLLIGMKIISELQYVPAINQWHGGKMYAPEKGITIDLKIISVHPDYIITQGSRFLFSKTMKWESAK